MLKSFIHFTFITYTLLLFIRIIGSWVPSFQQANWMRFVVYYTDPYLNVFRKIIPPIGGILDISPVLAFFILRMAENILLKIIP